MLNRYRQARIKALQSKENKDTEDVSNDHLVSNPASKTVYAFVDGKLVGEYDSITRCASILGMTRPMVKKAIDNGVVLDNGFLLTLTK